MGSMYLLTFLRLKLLQNIFKKYPEERSTYQSNAKKYSFSAWYLLETSSGPGYNIKLAANLKINFKAVTCLDFINHDQCTRLTIACPDVEISTNCTKKLTLCTRTMLYNRLYL